MEDRAHKPRFANARFKYGWRPYQARILESFHAHAADHHFHFIAPPGSGKTVLGLEIIRRLGYPALVFAPTTAVRDQWVARLIHDFLPPNSPDEGISKDILKPGDFTATTYQALDCINRKQDLDQLLEACLSAGVRTLVLDEAHHLRNEWWKCLTHLKKGIPDPLIIALTATPPWDVPRVEWNRYIQLCGPVDEEICIPELVKAGSLCPHQDYLFVIPPDPATQELLVNHSRAVSSLISDLSIDPDWHQWAQQIAASQASLSPRERLNQAPEHALALAIYLNHATGILPEAFARSLLLENLKLPPFDTGWAEIFLEAAIGWMKDDPKTAIPNLNSWLLRLRAIHAINRGKVLLGNCLHKHHSHAYHPRLLQAVAEIIDFESGLLRWDLRALILCDHIREDDFPDRDAGTPGLKLRLGVAPLFETLRQRKLPGLSLAAITGRFCILPLERLPHLLNQLPPNMLSRCRHEPLWWDPQFTRITLNGQDGAALLKPITSMLEQGLIHTLVGTSSLLGEGWDAPAVNTVILACETSSFMSSNQLRGRGIRTHTGVPEKTASIWHLACLSDDTVRISGTPCGSETAIPHGLKGLHRRFQSFPGLHHTLPIIENGLERLQQPSNAQEVALPLSAGTWNARMFLLAGARALLREKWESAISTTHAPRQRLFDEVIFPASRLPPLRKIPLGWYRPGSRWHWFTQWRLSAKLHRTASTLLRALQDTQRLPHEISPRSLKVRIDEKGFSVRLQADDTRIQTDWVNAFLSLFDPMDTVKYLILTNRGNRFFVPPILAEKKANAEAFLIQWNKHMGKASLLSTRTAEGQRHLLIAREQHLLHRLSNPITHSRRWG